MRLEGARGTVVAAALGLAALVSAPALARKPAKAAKAPPPPTADQQAIIAEVVEDTFRRPKREPFTFTLCLDVQIDEASDDEEAAAPAGAGRRRAASRVPEMERAPPIVHVRGAPPELVARLARPWRVVASALSCRFDSRRPLTLGDERHTAAQLVTVHLAPGVAGGPVKIDWTNGGDLAAANSRDCTASRGPRGFTVRCGGTWFQ
jgi:hypothetical protein